MKELSALLEKGIENHIADLEKQEHQDPEVLSSLRKEHARAKRMVEFYHKGTAPS
jgi:hypothetical protein